MDDKAFHLGFPVAVGRYLRIKISFWPYGWMKKTVYHGMVLKMYRCHGTGNPGMGSRKIEEIEKRRIISCLRRYH